MYICHINMYIYTVYVHAGLRIYSGITPPRYPPGSPKLYVSDCAFGRPVV